MTPTPEDVEAGWKVGGIMAAILTGLGFARWGHKNHEAKLKEHTAKFDEQAKRIEKIENDKRSAAECERLRVHCPVSITIGIQSALLEEIKDGQEKLAERIEEEFRTHNALHLEIAKELGKQSKGM